MGEGNHLGEGGSVVVLWKICFSVRSSRSQVLSHSPEPSGMGLGGAEEALSMLVE